MSGRIRVRFRLAAVLAGLALGCAAAAGPTEPPDPAAGASDDAAQAAQAAEPAPPPGPAAGAGAPAPPPPPAGPAPAPADTDDAPRFDVTIHDADAREFFLGLVEGTPENVVLDPEVSGRITLRLKQATVAEVMEAVEDAYGYEVRPTGYGYHVLPATLRTRLYRLDYLNVARDGSSETRVSSGQMTEGAARDRDALLTTDVYVRDPALRQETVTGSRIETRSEVDFWKDLAESLRTVVGEGDGRAVATNAHTGVVVIRAAPRELRQAEEFLEWVQARLRRQVILEARILEVRLDEGHQSGINWAALFTHQGTEGVVGQTGGGSFFEDGFSETAGNTGVLDPRMLSLVDGTATSAFGGVFSLALGGRDFSAFIELLSTQGDVNTLSSPRISTVNNQKAVIKVGSDEFFVTDVSSTVVTGTTTTTTPEITLTPFFSGIALDVTPQIGEEGEVVLHVHPSVSEVVDQTKTITVSGETQTLPLAFSTIRESDSIVRAASGQVVVIGGLMQTDDQTDIAGVPLLSRIPLLGRLFRHERVTKVKRELVILLRPTVAEAPELARELRQAAERLEALQPGAADALAWPEGAEAP